MKKSHMYYMYNVTCSIYFYVTGGAGAPLKGANAPPPPPTLSKCSPENPVYTHVYHD